jgi:hypothetical protein
LLRDDVHEARAAPAAHVAQCREQRRQIVAVDRADVAEAELLEEDARRQQRLGRLLHLQHDRLHDVADRCPSSG